MKLVEVKELPEQKTRVRHASPINEALKFMDMNVKYVRVDLDEGEYSSVASAAAAFRAILSQSDKNLPVQPAVVNTQLYLVRLDMA